MHESIRRITASRVHLAAGGILLLALLLRLWDLNARGLWFDEAMEYWVATAPIGDLLRAVREGIQDPPLYSFLLHFWMLPSDGESWLRMLSVVFGVGSVLGVMVIGYRLEGWSTALVGGSLMAIFPSAIRYSQEVGQYGPMQCMIVWSLVALMGLVRRPSAGGFARWGLFAVAGTYIYYGSVITLFVPFGCYVVEAAYRRDRRRVAGSLVTLAACGVAIVPLAVGFLPQQLHRGPTANAFQFVGIGTAREEIIWLWNRVQESFAFQATGWPCSSIPSAVSVATTLALLALSIPSARRFAAWFGVCWIAYSVITRFGLFPFGYRYTIVLTPLVLPLVGSVFRPGSGMVRRLAGGLAFGVLVSMCLISLPNRSVYSRVNREGWCAWPETEDIQKVTRFWFERRTPAQPTYVFYGAAPSFAYYVSQMADIQTERPATWYLDCWRNRDAGYCRDKGIYYGQWLRAMDPDHKIESIFTTLSTHPREMWLVFTHVQAQEDRVIVEGLQKRGYVIVDARVEAGAGVVLMRTATP